MQSAKDVIKIYHDRREGERKAFCDIMEKREERVMDKKALIIGCCGAGKSTLAKKMQERTGLPLIHLNHEYYRPGWVKPELKEFKEQREK